MFGNIGKSIANALSDLKAIPKKLSNSDMTSITKSLDDADSISRPVVAANARAFDLRKSYEDALQRADTRRLQLFEQGGPDLKAKLKLNETELRRTLREIESIASKENLDLIRARVSGIEQTKYGRAASDLLESRLRQSKLERYLSDMIAIKTIDDIKTFAKKYGLLIIAGLTTATILGLAAERYNSLNGKKFTITKLYKNGDGKIAVEFKEEEELSSRDTITILSSNSNPQLLGKHKIYDVVSKNKILLLATEETKQWKRDGDTGEFEYNATFGNMLSLEVTDVFRTGVDVATDAAEVAIDGIGEIATNTVLDPLKNTFSWAGDYAMWTSIAVAVVVASLSLLFTSITFLQLTR